jgi:hypothetical protein
VLLPSRPLIPCSVRLSLRRPSPAPAAPAVQGVVAIVLMGRPRRGQDTPRDHAGAMAARVGRGAWGGCSLRCWLAMVGAWRLSAQRACATAIACSQAAGGSQIDSEAHGTEEACTSAFRNVLSGQLNLASMSEICNLHLVLGADVIAIVARNHLADGLL